MFLMTNNRRKQKISAAAVLTALLLVVLFSVNALTLDLQTPVSLGVVPAGAEYLTDLDPADIVYDLYKVADAAEVPGFETYDFAVRDFYAGGANAVTVTRDMDADAWRTQAANAFVKALTENDTPLIRGKSLSEGEKLTTADDGSALLPGLYLLVARGADPALQDVSAFADLSDPEQPVSVVTSGNYIYTFAPALIALPYTSPDVDEQIATTADGEWNYDVTAHLKPERTERYGSIRIVKKLLNYMKGTNATFVFTVTAVYRGETVLQKEVTITFDGSSERIQEILVDHIPVGAVVTVEENTPQDGYFLVQAENDPQTVSADTIAEFLFANDYEEGTTPPPDTGDRTSLWRYMILAAVSGLALVLIGVTEFRKRKIRQ